MRRWEKTDSFEKCTAIRFVYGLTSNEPRSEDHDASGLVLIDPADCVVPSIWSISPKQAAGDHLPRVGPLGCPSYTTTLSHSKLDQRSRERCYLSSLCLC